MSFMDWLTGSLSNQDYNNISQVQNPNAANYQIAGMQGYQNTLQGLGQQAGANNIDQSNANQTRGMQEQSLDQLQNQANGGLSYAQQFMQQNQQAALRSAQAQALSSQASASPGLAYRGLLNAQGALQSQMASQGALQKVQEQQQAQQAYAQQLSNMRQQDFGQAQQVAQQTSNNLAQQGQFAGAGFGANAQQTQNNMQMQNLMTQIQQQKRMQDLQQAQSQAAESGTLVRGIGGAASSLLGGIAAGPLGASIGSSLFSGLAGGGGQAMFSMPGGGQISANMLNSLSTNAQGTQGGQYVTQNNPYMRG